MKTGIAIGITIFSILLFSSGSVLSVEKRRIGKVRPAANLAVYSRTRIAITRLRSCRGAAGKVRLLRRRIHRARRLVMKMQRLKYVRRNRKRLARRYIAQSRRLSIHIARARRDLRKLFCRAPARRKVAKTAFENFDKKTNQLFNMLSTVMKSMKEMRQATQRNML